MPNFEKQVLHTSGSWWWRCVYMRIQYPPGKKMNSMISCGVSLKGVFGSFTRPADICASLSSGARLGSMEALRFASYCTQKHTTQQWMFVLWCVPKTMDRQNIHTLCTYNHNSVLLIILAVILIILSVMLGPLCFTWCNWWLNALFDEMIQASFVWRDVCWSITTLATIHRVDSTASLSDAVASNSTAQLLMRLMILWHPSACTGSHDIQIIQVHVHPVGQTYA